MLAALLATVPSSLIAQRWLRRHGREVELLRAGEELLQVGPTWLKVALVTLNFAVVGAALWLLVRLG